MEQIKKFIDIYVPVTTCNLRCEYCYITQNRLFDSKLPEFKYSAEYIGKALSKERLGGVCHLNMCGNGETLLPIEIVDIIKELLKAGHYIFVVTNGVLSKRFDEISKFPKELLDRLGFKFSFHYKELKEKKLMKVFFDNVEKMKNAGCSFTVEITPHDEIIDEIENIKKICMEEVGALCHVTVARLHKPKKGIPILTEHTRDEYQNIWGQFKSNLFEFKLSIFEKKRKEFCYAGDWSYQLDIGTGEMKQCYASNYSQNIFKNINKPIKKLAIGKCKQPHCYNGHVFLTLGTIPELDTPTYASMRNRVTESQGKWLNKNMNEFLSGKLVDNNEEYSEFKKKWILFINPFFGVLDESKMKFRAALRKIKRRKS